MSAQPHLTFHTPEQYFGLCSESGSVRLEYDRGLIYAMTGGSPDHSIIQMNIGAWFKSTLPKPSCRVHSSDMRVALPGEAYFYPDLSVVCGKQEFERRPDGQMVLLNPLLVVEVTSPSTQDLDRTRKYEVYTAMPSVQHYLIVAQEQAQIVYYHRSTAGWTTTLANALPNTLDLVGLGRLPLEAVYEQVSWLSDDF